MPLVFIARKGKRIQKLTKIVKMEEVKKSYLLRDLTNFNEISRKSATYNDIKSDKKKQNKAQHSRDSTVFERYS